MNSKFVKQIDTLVIGPGGTKGFVFLGHLYFLEQNKLLLGIRRYFGVSIGSIICLLHICGYTIWEIVGHAKDIELFDIGNFQSIADIIMNHSLVSFGKLKDQFEKLVSDKFGMIPTMKELYDLTGKEFTTVGSNISKDIPEATYFNYNTFPDILCTEACLLSSSIPGVFKKYEYNGQFYVDGALTDPYPVGYEYTDETRVIGLSVVSLHDVNSIGGYLFQCVQSSIIAIRNLIIKSLPHSLNNLEENIHLICKVKTNQTGSLIINDLEKVNFFTEGYAQMKDLFPSEEIFKSKDITEVPDEVTYDD